MLQETVPLIGCGRVGFEDRDVGLGVRERRAMVGSAERFVWYLRDLKHCSG